MLSMDRIACAKRHNFTGIPGAGLRPSLKLAPSESATLHQLQEITPVSAASIKQVPVERLQLMPASALSKHLAKLGEAPLTSDQKILNHAGYQRVTIGGKDNRCWIRAPWFAILNQHIQNNTFTDLKSAMVQALEYSNNPDVQRWFQHNQAIVDQAFAELESPTHQSNFTLNKQGYFSPAVEALIENVSKAAFSNNPHSNIELVTGEKISALKLLENGRVGYQLFSSLLMGQFGANAPLHSDKNDFNQSSMMVEWLGSDQFLNKQAECMIFHRSTHSGHFEIMLKNNNFKPCEHGNTFYAPKQQQRSLIQPTQLSNSMTKFWAQATPVQKSKAALNLLKLHIFHSVLTAKHLCNNLIFDLLQSLQKRRYRPKVHQTPVQIPLQIPSQTITY